MGATEEMLETEEKAARRIVEEAVEFAKSSPLPGLDTLYEGTYAGT
jgi:TPP-dependent pyruvate/acetoin dehydrogenase alpha subunit